ncbi:hypothetical protein APE02nite_19710 [Alkalibacterium pelagium]|nr:hypothetical protein APE02nite_19710 [Alkalibacterium pelagium]
MDDMSPQNHIRKKESDLVDVPDDIVNSRSIETTGFTGAGALRIYQVKTSALLAGGTLLQAFPIIVGQLQLKRYALLMIVE